MAQVSYGTITITDTNDIESIYMEYAQSTSNQTAPTSGWDTDIPTWQQGYYIWQRTVTKMSGVPLSSDSYGEPICLTGSTGSTGATGRGVSSIVTTYCNYGTGEPAASYSGWQSTVPTYDSTKPNYWVKTVITYTIGTPATDTTIYKDNGITNATSTAAAANSTAQAASNKADDAWDKADNAETIAGNANSAISDLNQYFWRQKTATTNVPAGSYVTNIPGTTYKNDPAQGGFNSLVQATGIFLRNGITTLSSWTGTALTFNNPSSGNAQLIIGANGTLQSGNYTRGSDSKFSSNGTKIDLINGDIITKYFRVSQGLETGLNAGVYVHGTIEALDGTIGGTSGWTIASQQISSGSIGTSNSMFLSTKDLAGTVAGTTLTTTEGPSWRLTVGSNFGVDNTGKLYATGVKISGDLTADSLSTGGRTSSTAAAGTYIDANGAIYGGNNKFTVTKEGALTAEGAVLNNLYFKDQYKTYGFLGWTTSESSGLIGSYEITSDWYEEHASDSTLVLTYAYTNSFSSPFILKKNGDIIPTSTNYYQISTSISINTVTVTINLTTVGVDDGDEFSVYATNKNNTHYYIALNGYDDSYKYGQGSFSCGESCEASGIFSTAIGRSVKVTGIGSFGQGREHKVTGPYCSATGVNNTVNTYFSHAEGGYNLIDEEANVAHAEGWHTTITADGNGAHTEGGYTTATAQSAHAEGDYTLASGAESHAGGYYTIAQGMCQTVIGAFNEAIGTPNSVPDRTVPVFIIGNGTREDSRSNALTVDWAGNVTANDYYSKITTLNLGTYVATGFISNSCGAIGFSIPTGRVFPSGTTISKITFSMTARVSRGTAAANAGIYCITSSSDGTVGTINYNSTASTKFYNASGVQKTLTTSITTIGLYGGTNIYIYWKGDNYLFGANSLYINNKPVVLTLTGINVTFNIPT